MKKVKIKAFMVVSPHDRSLHMRENIFIGGVASSASGEKAAEEGGFVVELTGEYDYDCVIEMRQNQVDNYKEHIRKETVGDIRFRSYPKNPERQAAHVAELMEILHSLEKELEEAKKENELND